MAFGRLQAQLHLTVNQYRIERGGLGSDTHKVKYHLVVTVIDAGSFHGQVTGNCFDHDFTCFSVVCELFRCQCVIALQDTDRIRKLVVRSGFQGKSERFAFLYGCSRGNSRRGG